MRRICLIAPFWLLACGAPDDEQPPPSAPEAVEKIRNGVVTDERPEVGHIGGCTATLVAQDVAITAAHCVGYGTRTNPGNYYNLRLTNGGETRSFRVNRYRAFSRDLGRNDIALLGMSEMVPLDFAEPAPLARDVPANGAPLTVYGYGCTRIGGRGDGRKRRATYEQGQDAYHLCPGDSGGPVFNDETGAVARINSGYMLDGRNTDIYGLVPGLYEELRAQVDEWTQGEVPEEGDPLGGLDPSVEVCGRNVDVFETWTCTASRGHRHRCLPGGKPTWEACEAGCVSGAKGAGDRCAPADAQDSCGEVYRPYADWVCATDDLTLVRCQGGALELRRCALGCRATDGVADGCLE